MNMRFVSKVVAGTVAAVALLLGSVAGPAQAVNSAKGDTGWGITSGDTGWG